MSTFYQILTGSGVLTKDYKMFGEPPRNNREKFYQFLQESDDLFAIIESPRTHPWREFLAEYPDVRDLIVFEMPYPISCALHGEKTVDDATGKPVPGFPERRRTKLIILKGKKYEG